MSESQRLLPLVQEATLVNVRHRISELGSVEFVKSMLADMEKNNPVLFKMLNNSIMKDPNNKEPYVNAAAVCLFYRVLQSQAEADALADELEGVV